ncbi:MAG TPA: NAD(P)-binding domain-containing protein [Acidobacteriota bacterium]|nr:NAD(P)-binding domain-containing protein [Acidobacteriota bacterium]
MRRPVKAVKSLFDTGFDPARARRLPVIGESGESNVSGLYLAGEIAGTPLIKLGLNRGRAVIDHIVNNDLGIDPQTRDASQDGWDPSQERQGQWLDVLIVGAGSAGLGAADRCQQLGLRYLVIESQRPAQLIRNFTKGKPLYMEPPNEDNQTRFFCQECKKEELLEKWDQQIKELGIAPHIRTFETVEGIQRQGDKDGFQVKTDKDQYLARRVVLAIGMAGNPRRLEVPGESEHGGRIDQNVIDPGDWKDRDLVVFGAGDVACEAAVALADQGNRVAMAAPDKEFTFPKQRNVDKVMERVEQGKIDLYLRHAAQEIGPESVTIKSLEDGSTKELPADHIFRCIGADLPLDFFDRVGIRLEGSWNLRRAGILAAVFLVCYFIYGAKASPPLWPFDIPLDFFGGQSFGQWWQGLQIGEGRWAFKVNGSFWYSLAYCLVMTVFGIKAYRRWGVRYDDSYQRKRFKALVGAQWTLAFLIPNGVMWFVHGLWPDNAVLGWRGNWWHASGFEYAFPLFFWQFFWDVGWLYLIYGLAATLVVIPILTIWHGKRYCTWLCGCGGLAETLGDPWRHLAPKGDVSIRWEWMNAAVLIWAVAALALVAGKIGLGYWVSGEAFTAPTVDQHGALTTYLFSGYRLIADIWLVGIIPVALYPIFGGKIWCRYWCPLAKWMQMTSRWFGTLQISSNDKCITCGECSRYCEVGIDVMSFAKNQQDFHNGNSSCIQCGICITVCPLDVLSFNNNHTGAVTQKLQNWLPSGQPKHPLPTSASGLIQIQID